jgi:hypothetical protein
VKNIGGSLEGEILCEKVYRVGEKRWGGRGFYLMAFLWWFGKKVQLEAFRRIQGESREI